MIEQESAYQPTRGIPPRETKLERRAGRLRIQQSHLRGLLLKPVDGPLVDAPTFVDEMPRCGGLARIMLGAAQRGEVCSVHELTASCPKLNFLGTGPAQPAEGEVEKEISSPRGERRGLSHTSHLRMLWSLPQPQGGHAYLQSPEEPLVPPHT